MTTAEARPGMAGGETVLFRAVFVIAALWNFAGAIPGRADPAGMFAREFERELADPVMVAVYRGAWGTAFLCGFGFLLVARDLVRHTGVVAMGGLGKLLFALNLLVMYRPGWTSDFALVVIVGDTVFVAVFALYFAWLKRLGVALI